jgi:hypothetical protein
LLGYIDYHVFSVTCNECRQLIEELQRLEREHAQHLWTLRGTRTQSVGEAIAERLKSNVFESRKRLQCAREALGLHQREETLRRLENPEVTIQ